MLTELRATNKSYTQQKYCCNWGLTEYQSAAVHIQALVSADGILPIISSKHQLLFINLASVPGRQLVISPTAAILERWQQAYGDIKQLYRTLQKNKRHGVVEHT